MPPEGHFPSPEHSQDRWPPPSAVPSVSLRRQGSLACFSSYSGSWFPCPSARAGRLRGARLSFAAAQVPDILLLSPWLCLYSIIQSSAELHQPARSQAASALLAHELHTREAPWKVTDYFSPTGLLLCLVHLCATETRLSIILSTWWWGLTSPLLITETVKMKDCKEQPCQAVPSQHILLLSPWAGGEED